METRDCEQFTPSIGLRLRRFGMSILTLSTLHALNLRQMSSTQLTPSPNLDALKWCLCSSHRSEQSQHPTRSANRSQNFNVLSDCSSSFSTYKHILQCRPHPPPDQSTILIDDNRPRRLNNVNCNVNVIYTNPLQAPRQTDSTMTDSSTRVLQPKALFNKPQEINIPRVQKLHQLARTVESAFTKPHLSPVGCRALPHFNNNGDGPLRYTDYQPWVTSCSIGYTIDYNYQ